MIITNESVYNLFTQKEMFHNVYWHEIVVHIEIFMINDLITFILLIYGPACGIKRFYIVASLHYTTASCPQLTTLHE